MKIFHEKISLHEIIYYLQDFYRFGGNLFSRIYLFRQFYRIAHISKEFCQNYFEQLTLKEIKLYLFHH